MCGINGFIKTIDKKKSDILIKNINQSIIHRGPDDQWFFCKQINNDKVLAQWQVRLSIIDLTDTGFQPMFYDKYVGWFSKKHHPEVFEEIGEKSVSIVFNGEIYNYQEIRKELIDKWYNFASNSDTEVILASYLERGADCVSKFNGMWAFALYDPIKKELFCSRDRLGKKPFYYYFDDKQFVFSSELKWILEHKELKINIKENINSEALDFYFTMWYIPAPWTIYKNVKKLEARNYLLVSHWEEHSDEAIQKKELDCHAPFSHSQWQLKLTKHCYYEIPKYQPINDKKLLLEEGKKLLEDTVKIRMFTSEVPVGAFLSGWLDSSAVVWEMTKWIDKKKIHTFSIWFEGKYDESKYIHIVEKAFGTNHHHEYFKQDNFEEMIDDIYHYYDEPFADYSNFPTMFVSKLAKKNVSVSLSGDGWDEIFGGYLMHQVGAQMALIQKIPRIFREIFWYLVPKTKNNLSILSKIKEAFRVSLLPLEQFYANIWWSYVYKPEIYKKRTEEKFSEILTACNRNFTQAMIDFDLFYNTLGDNFLVKTDRASMSQALEIRSPFCDIRWIEWSRKVPTKWKVNYRKTKIMMRNIIKDIVPDTITNRWKQWFTPPIDTWILQEKYIQEIKTGIEKLYKDWILSKDWYELYKNSVINTNNSVFNTYKIKLFLLIKWMKKRID